MGFFQIEKRKRKRKIQQNEKKKKRPEDKTLNIEHLKTCYKNIEEIECEPMHSMIRIDETIVIWKSRLLIDRLMSASHNISMHRAAKNQNTIKKKQIFHVHSVMEIQWTAHSLSERDERQHKNRNTIERNYSKVQNSNNKQQKQRHRIAKEEKQRKFRYRKKNLKKKT